MTRHRQTAAAVLMGLALIASMDTLAGLAVAAGAGAMWIAGLWMPRFASGATALAWTGAIISNRPEFLLVVSALLAGAAHVVLHRATMDLRAAGRLAWTAWLAGVLAIALLSWPQWLGRTVSNRWAASYDASTSGPAVAMALIAAIVATALFGVRLWLANQQND